MEDPISLEIKRLEGLIAESQYRIKNLKRFRIRETKHGGFRIDEIVSSAGYYIDWPILYGSRKEAFREILNVL